MTASSTSAAIRRGLLTETSTPHWSVKSHSFSARLTRATTRGTANSVLASSESTRLTLSSPVAATTTSQLARSASCRLASSQQSARIHSAVGHPLRAQRRRLPLDQQHGVPFSISSWAIERPTLPAPAMATLIVLYTSQALAGSVPVISVTLADHVVGHQHEDLVAVLQHGRRRGQRADAEPHDERGAGTAGLLERPHRLGRSSRGAAAPRRWTPCWSGRATAPRCPRGTRWRSIRSAVHRTVATVGMPSRS